MFLFPLAGGHSHLFQIVQMIHFSYLLPPSTLGRFLMRWVGLLCLVQRREAKQGAGYSMAYEQAYWKITALGEDALSEVELISASRSIASSLDKRE